MNSNFYLSKRWKAKRKHILRLDKHKDKVAEMYGRTQEGNIVHHIYPLSQHPEWALEDWNLITVSVGTHNKLEDRINGTLTEEGRHLQQIIKPYDNWRRKEWNN